MGVLFDYFAAPSDSEAAATIDWLGGPGQPQQPVPAKRRGLFARSRNKKTSELEIASYPTVADTGVDPVVQAGTLEALLTGRTYEQVAQDPRCGHPLAVRDGGEGLVVTLTDGLIDALARSSPEELAAAAEPWSTTEEFWGDGEPEQLTAFLLDLSALAVDARTRGASLYCWVCV